MTRRDLTVLMVDKYHFIKGGAERYLFELRRLLEAEGHRVVPFASRHPRNRPDRFDRYFVSHASFGEDGPVPAWRAPLLLARAIHGREARSKIRSLLAEIRPDLAHLHMIDHQISPSILGPLRAAGVPILQTVHHYKAVCPSYRLYDERRAEICERCVGKLPWRAALRRCHKGSFLSSTALAIEGTLDRLSRRERQIALYHAPSRFMAEKLEQGGIAAERIRCFPYAIDVRGREPRQPVTDKIVSFGRLSPEKGLSTLIAAAARLPRRQIEIIGEGPERGVLESEARGLDNVTFRGRLGGAPLEKAVGEAALAVVASEWYENSPLAIYEAFALGTPVVGARIGGIPELVREGETGALFTPGDSTELAETLERLLADRSQLTTMRQAARAFALRELDWSVHAPRLLACYDEILGRTA